MKFAIVTPSYYGDFARCALLTETIERFVPAEIPYYIAVSRTDHKLFSALKSRRTQILMEEEIVGFKTFPIPWARRWRLSTRTLPVRNWIWQQIVKLSLARVINEDGMMIVDSDCAFFRPFDPRKLVDHQGRIPLYREEKEFYAKDNNTQKWHHEGQKILKINKFYSPPCTGYVAAPIFWRRDVLINLQYFIRSKHLCSAPCLISCCPTFSEYVLYGMYVEHVIGLTESGHYPLSQEIAQNHWTERPLSLSEIKSLCDTAAADQAILHINGKSNTPVDTIRKIIFH